MSLITTILSKIFAGHDETTSPVQSPSVTPPPADAGAEATRASDLGTSLGAAAGSAFGNPSSVAPVSSPPASQPVSTTSAAPSPLVDVPAVMNRLSAANPEKLDWKHSIVDLMKLLDMDSSLTSRKELAAELHYPGNTSDSASMNIWLHQEVLKKLSENGGNVPADLLA